MEREIWKDIKGFEGLYQVSNMGRVKSLGRLVATKNGKTYCVKEKIMSIHIDKQGYQCVHLRKSGGFQYEKKIHQLVGIAFIPNPDNKPFIDHINTIRDDNRIENLRWCTSKENSNNSLTKIKMSSSQKGKTGVISNHHKSIMQFDINGNLLKQWDTITEAAKCTGTNRTSIVSCANGKYKMAGGYIWKYTKKDKAA